MERKLASNRVGIGEAGKGGPLGYFPGNNDLHEPSMFCMNNPRS
jgi:hypothetical protein